MLARTHKKPIWLMTLADLALLLMGFFVLMLAVERREKVDDSALARGFRGGFTDQAALPQPRIALAANAVPGFAPGSAALPQAPDSLIAWARESAADPRTSLLVTGFADGSEADRLDGSALALASARASAVAATLERAGFPGGRIRTAGAVARDARRVTVTISFGS